MKAISGLFIVLLKSGAAFAEALPIESSKLIQYDLISKLVTEKNDQVKSSRFEMESDQTRIGKLKRSFLPELHFEGGYEQTRKEHLNDSPSRQFWKLSANFNLINGGRDWYENKIRNVKANLAELNFKSDLQRNIFEAKEKYLNIIFINKKIALLKQTQIKNERQLILSKRRTRAGTASAGDSYQFELKKIEISRKITELELQIDAEKNALSVLIGEDDHKNLVVQDEFPPLSNIEISEYVAHNRTDKPEKTFTDTLSIKTQQALTQIHDFSSAEAKNWWLPKLDLYATYKLPSLSDDYPEALNQEKEQFAGVKLSFELENLFEKLSEASAQRFNLKAAKATSEFKSRKTKAVIHEIEHDLLVLSKFLSTADQDISLAEKFYNTTTDEYNRGVKNGPDLIGALENYNAFVMKKNEYLLRYFVLKNELKSLFE
jgi:outer membrane protein